MEQQDDNISVPPIETNIRSETTTKKRYYFDNDRVEELLINYAKGGCVDVELRDKIMSHASELIKQVIRTHKLHLVYQGRDKTGFSDLFQIAWTQIESTLYKFDYSTGHKKVFNMWSQISRTVILAHIKKESRHKNKAYATSYKRHVLFKAKHKGPDFERFINELSNIYNGPNATRIIEAIRIIYNTDEKPHDNLINKIIDKTSLPKSIILPFLEDLRSNSFRFSDSPENLSQKYPNIEDNHDNDEANYG